MRHLRGNQIAIVFQEPMTSLDPIYAVGTQLIEPLVLHLGLSRRARERRILITHDLGVVAEFADRVAVMYAGRIVEEAPVGPFYDHPNHAYAEGLLQSMPQLETRTRRLPAIEGTVPNPFALPSCPTGVQRAGAGAVPAAAGAPGGVHPALQQQVPAGGRDGRWLASA